MRDGRIWSMLAGLVLGVALTLVGLANAGRLRPPEDPEVLVALGQLVEAEHRRVDLMVEQGDIEGAIEALETLRGTDWPTRKRGGDASLLLRHDVYGELVRLRLDYPEIDPVDGKVLLEIIDEGLGDDYELVDPNPFTARLVALKGEVLETLDRDEEALDAYEEALDMNRVVLDELLEAGEAP